MVLHVPYKPDPTHSPGNFSSITDGNLGFSSVSPSSRSRSMESTGSNSRNLLKNQSPRLVDSGDSGGGKVRERQRRGVEKLDDTTPDDSDTDTLFSPVKVGDNVIALRSMVNGSFCMRISEESKENRTSQCSSGHALQGGTPSDGKIEISAELTAGLQWGETVTTKNQVETEDTFTVPPMSKVTVSLLVRQGSCNVPFSYTQCDTLMNGQTNTLYFDDGVYTGVNGFNFENDIETKEL
ncbi:hypothetical protein RHGRI_012943 [Rhododendron griersonianum]|uniref:Uncharacterized protein n=1 Tax=Rhododendron griersonianum TaxID=479676 RepID=A0AAV6K419_9ERIC|nr:hypothetical protein RHGRI_012943 [Rhododendron griersonianum]